MCKLRFILTMLLLIVLVAASDFGEAAPIINIAPAGAAAYSITATDLSESAGIDLSITYDTATLEAPQVKSGALTVGAMMDKNTATPGIVRIVFVTGGVIKGTGELASITFTKKGNSPPQQPKLTSSAYSESGSQLAVLSTSGAPQIDPIIEGSNKDNKVNNPSGTGGGSATINTGIASTTTSQSTTQASTTLGSVSLPQEPVNKNDLLREGSLKEERVEETAYLNVPSNPAASTGSSTAAASESAVPVAVPGNKTTGAFSTLKSSQSVLDRFRTYKDIRTVKRLSILFDESALHAAGIVQSPAIVVSDGKSLVTVAVDLAHEADASSFSLKGANLKSIRRVSDKKWELDALPQKGKSDVRLSIILKGERTEIPLVAVPPLDKVAAGLAALSVSALDALLAKPLKNNKPAYDLNSDGRQDYLDDYILVAHWLLKQQRSENKVGRKPAAAGK